MRTHSHKEALKVTTTNNKGFEAISRREQGLKRQLTAGQMSMIAIGGAIGTGLFMGSAYAIGYAGPGVLVSYAIGALITLLLMGCLAEMTVAHSTSGSFGAFAEFYISPLAGFLVRYAYWAAMVLGVGTEVTAIAIYMKYWFANVAEWVWIVSFSSVLILLNAISVKTFGRFEYWFSTIKIAAIVGFILLAVYVIFGSGNGDYGVHHYTAHGGFLPNGFQGMWVAVIVSIFSYVSVEMIAVAAGEAKDPQRAVKQAFRATIVRLVVFYLLTLALMLAIVPWADAGNVQSPFVTVMQLTGIPWATGVMNFVILIAALSAMNSQLYITTRMMFSLSRGGYAPRALGSVSKSGIPLNALLLSSSGIALATLVNLLYPASSFIMMMSLAMFGAIFTWFMIFLTHYFFRRYYQRHGELQLSFRMRLFPYSTLLGLVLMGAVMITTFFTEAFRMTLVFGVPFLLLLTLVYWLFLRKPRDAVDAL
ncbi:General amino acid permease AGP1 Asparagine/glutamine permease [Erwinia piriflorinigrans CFBP 5888]|uniref:General amino acid permease AGP1 Asparagine/glutamine permease n=1 Tax=Erwinia piriflorinigrans CFBP 5888 TaxID=1161919 RepID=V5Z4E4_9GAMM|nr:General amino acid permease AGP1 Asparagine/glutamine permease [Erwinia piriflorinigrans CFBP 5888]